MSILFLISSEGYYGAENVVVTLARQLSLKGFACVVGVIRNSQSPHTEVGEQAKRFGIPVEIIPCEGKWDRRSVHHVRRLLAVHNVSIVHAHGYKADLYAYAAAWPNRVALVATSHNWTGKLLKMRAYAALDRLVLRRFDEVVVVSEFVGQKLRRWGVAASKLSMIRNGIDIQGFQGAPATLRNELAPSGGALVGFVGRLVPEKGGEVLLRAAKRVLAVRSEIKFVLVGDGPARQEWERLASQLGISEQVIFAGRREDMASVYASLDMVVLPSLLEALPMCLLEAMAAGKPVIATRVGAVPQVIQSREAGLLLQPGEVDGLADAIVRLLKHPELARQVGENGQAQVAQHFSAEAMAKSYIATYQQALGRRGTTIQGQATWEENLNEAAAVKVTVIVACRNEIGHIREFLESLLTQDMTGISWEGIIADGESDDGTREFLEVYTAQHRELRVVLNPGRIVSTGLNAAIRMARGEVIIRMDAHTSYAPDYCRRCVEELERRGADNVGGPARTRATGARARAVAAAYHSRFSTGGARFHDADYEGWVDTVPYGCWRKATLVKIGLFDESLVRNQDDELNLRLQRMGGRIWQSPLIVSWYAPRPTLSSLFRQYFQYGFWKVAVIRKHWLPASWRHMVPIAFVLANILLPAGMVITRALGARPWFAVSSALWFSMTGLYAAALLVASLLAAKRNGWRTLPHLPAVFTTYHISYGLGFLAGLRWYVSNPTPKSCLSAVFTRISR